MRRLLLMLLAAALVAAALALATASTDAAAGEDPGQVAAEAAGGWSASGERVDSGVVEPGAELVLRAWARAGAPVSRVVADVARAGGPEARFSLFWQEVCGPVIADPRSDPPRAGDIAVYTGADGRPGARRRHAALVLDAADAAVVPPDGGAVQVVPLIQVLGDPSRAAGDPMRAANGSAVICHASTVLAPAAGRAEQTAGRVALVDPVHAEQLAGYDAAHPRDADTSLGHRLQLGAGFFAVALDVATAGLVAIAESVATLFDRIAGLTGGLPVVGGVLVLGWRLLSLSFDGRRIHQALTVAALVLLAGSLGPIGIATIAVMLGAALLGVPGVGRLGAALWGATSFLVTLLTGVADGETSVGVVLISVLSSLCMLRPAVLVGRVAALAARLLTVARPLARSAPVLTRTLELAVAHGAGPASACARAVGGAVRRVGAVAGDLQDAVQLRPRVLSRLPLPARAVSAQRSPLGSHLVDVASFAWRPASAFSVMSTVAETVAVAPAAVAGALPPALLADIAAHVPVQMGAMGSAAVRTAGRLGDLASHRSGLSAAVQLAGGGGMRPASLDAVPHTLPRAFDVAARAAWLRSLASAAIRADVP